MLKRGKGLLCVVVAVALLAMSGTALAWGPPKDPTGVWRSPDTSEGTGLLVKIDRAGIGVWNMITFPAEPLCRKLLKRPASNLWLSVTGWWKRYARSYAASFLLWKTTRCRTPMTGLRCRISRSGKVSATYAGSKPLARPNEVCLLAARSSISSRLGDTARDRRTTGCCGIAPLKAGGRSRTPDLSRYHDRVLSELRASGEKLTMPLASRHGTLSSPCRFPAKPAVEYRQNDQGQCGRCGDP